LWVEKTKPEGETTTWRGIKPDRISLVRGGGNLRKKTTPSQHGKQSLIRGTAGTRKQLKKA